MRLCGYSTGALAYGDFRRALRMLRGTRADAVELSALRLDELEPLVEASKTLDLSQFRHISVHAPSQFPAAAEPEVVRQLTKCTRRGWPVIAHPDALHDCDLWRSLGDLLYLENMDKRKPIGRTVQELDSLFMLYPKAGFCFDIAHARQVDSSMLEAYSILRRFRSRLRQIHISEVSSQSRHDRLSWAAIRSFQEIARYIPRDTPLIIEAPVPEADLELELQRSLDAVEPPVAISAAP
ncbi:MAG: hypothetical protein ACO1SX_17785 [Actinomycetota bacterium]